MMAVLKRVVLAASDVTPEPSPQMPKSHRRRKKRWKVSCWMTMALAISSLMTFGDGHVMSDLRIGEDAFHIKHLKSDGSFELLGGSSNTDWSTAKDSNSDFRDENSTEKNHFVTDTESPNSKYLTMLQLSFERHFKEKLVCDHHDVTITSDSGSISLETIILGGCKNLTNLFDILPQTLIDVQMFRESLKNLTVTKSQNLKTINLKGLRSLRRLVLHENSISSFEVIANLPDLQVLVLDSNPLKHFDAISIMSFTPNLRQLSLANCSHLESIESSQAPYQSATGLLVNLETLTFNDNPSLMTICPWLLRSAPHLAAIFVNRCSKLQWTPTILADRRFFGNLETVETEGTPSPCDCKLAISKANSSSFVNLNIIQHLREQLRKQKTCSLNGTTTSVEQFLDQPEVCAEQVNELNSTNVNSEISVTWFDPYAEESDPNQTELVLTDIEPSEVNLTYVWTTVTLNCQLDQPVDSIFWVTPTNDIFLVRNESGTTCQPTAPILSRACGTVAIHDNEATNVKIFKNGTLAISDFGYKDRGVYECVAASEKSGRIASTARVEIFLDQVFRLNIYNLSLIYGFAVSGAFLLLTLLFKLIHFLLHNYGCCLFCCCCENKLPPKARRLKRAMESIEVYRTQQLEKLRENYTQQSDWIRMNCASQMERVRENYNTQIQNLKDIRQYGTTQLTAVRGQYYEQMSRIRDYSANQLDRVHENYIFQRQRLRKFSAQNYLRVQETRVYTRRTLNKVMENIPNLYLDLTTCRQGLGERQPSIEWMEPDQFLELDQLSGPIQRKRLFREQSEHRSDSVYFTPTGTPLREISGSLSGMGYQSNSLKNTPTREIDPYKAVYTASGERKYPESGHRRNRSFSQFLPPLPNWLTSSSSAGFLAGNLKQTKDHQPFREVEVVIEHETNSNDYYLAGDESTTTMTTLSKSPLSRSRRRSCSLPSDEAATHSGKPSHTSSEALCSSLTSDSGQPNSENSPTAPLLAHRRAVMNSMICVHPHGDVLQQKRMSL